MKQRLWSLAGTCWLVLLHAGVASATQAPTAPPMGTSAGTQVASPANSDSRLGEFAEQTPDADPSQTANTRVDLARTTEPQERGDTTGDTGNASEGGDTAAQDTAGALTLDNEPVAEAEGSSAAPEVAGADDRQSTVPAEAATTQAAEAADSETDTSPAPQQPAAPPVDVLADEVAEVQTPFFLNLRTRILLGVVLASLAIASLVGQYLRRQPSEYVNPALVRRFRQRINAWWLMCAILVFGLLLESTGTVVLFGLVSFWALREFITMAPTRRGDHRALFWALIVFTPLQYVLIGLELSGYRWRNGSEIDFYGLYSIVIPVYASLFVPARIAMSGDPKRFLERSAQITVGLLICVYALSYAPALINLDLTTSDGTPWMGSPAGLLFFFVLVSQLSDILQWTWGYLVGKRVIAPDVSSSRTWEGFAGGTLSVGLIGGGLMWVTPFSFWEAACMSMVIGVMGMFGGMTMSAIKRDRGVNDYGSLVLGHAGVLDRIDTICFAAPVFYHLTRFFFSAA